MKRICQEHLDMTSTIPFQEVHLLRRCYREVCGALVRVIFLKLTFYHRL
jgi:hypothetical protein